MKIKNKLAIFSFIPSIEKRNSVIVDNGFHWCVLVHGGRRVCAWGNDEYLYSCVFLCGELSCGIQGDGCEYPYSLFEMRDDIIAGIITIYR